jgi:hypothetical protein
MVREFPPEQILLCAEAVKLIESLFAHYGEYDEIGEQEISLLQARENNL